MQTLQTNFSRGKEECGARCLCVVNAVPRGIKSHKTPAPCSPFQDGKQRPQCRGISAIGRRHYRSGVRRSEKTKTYPPILSKPLRIIQAHGSQEAQQRHHQIYFWPRPYNGRANFIGWPTGRRKRIARKGTAYFR